MRAVKGARCAPIRIAKAKTAHGYSIISVATPYLTPSLLKSKERDVLACSNTQRDAFTMDIA